ncbi:hypothetical protein CDD83_5969 [Cordyceps sp. RAO-2017]|nr:hypothetical protein CDD83_5969 [Cordyceps sp. RAO-2017]
MRETIRQEQRLRQAQEKEMRDTERIRQRVVEANAEIASRPVVPVPSLPRRASATTTNAAAAGHHRRSQGSGSGAKGRGSGKDRETELVEQVRRLDLEERRAERERDEEDEAQRARLRERMVPRRRATVGPGSRRHRTLYDDGLYRWE